MLLQWILLLMKTNHTFCFLHGIIFFIQYTIIEKDICSMMISTILTFIRVALIFFLFGLLILGLVLSGVAISLVFTRVLRPLHGIITLEDSSCGGPFSQIVLVVVDGLDFETVGSVGLERGEAALCRDLEGAGFTLR